MRGREGFHWFRRWHPSGRQRRVLDALVLGRSNADIAADLSISLDGAKWHVGQLLTETGLDDRDQLAQWWRGEREAVGGRRAVGSFLAILARAAVAAPVVLIAIWLVTANFRFSGNSDEKAQASLPATVAAPLAAIAAPTPSPTPMLPGAWIFDVDAKIVDTVPPANAYMQWLDADRFVTYAGPRPVVTDRAGNVLVQLPANAGRAYAEPGSSNVLAWDGQANRLYEVGPDGQTTTLLELGPAPAGKPGDASRQVAISPVSRMLALADPGDPSTSISVMRRDGVNRRTVWMSPPGLSIEGLSWSPDGSKLLVLTSARTFQGVRPVTVLVDTIVIDMAGRELLRRPATDYGVIWLGSDRVLIAMSGQGQAGGSEAVDLATGQTSVGPSLTGLFCTSPDGRFGVYGELSAASSSGRTAHHRVVDLQSGAVLLEAQTRPEIGSCEWTADSKKVVLSPGGK